MSRRLAFSRYADKGALASLQYNPDFQLPFHFHRAIVGRPDALIIVASANQHMLDANGAYYPVIPDVDTLPYTRGTLRQGAGAPSNDLGVDGDVYVNKSTGDVYTKSGDVWTLISPGTGATEIIRGVVDDPNGTHTPTDTTKVALYFRDSAGNDNIQFWRWSVADQEWKDVITT